MGNDHQLFEMDIISHLIRPKAGDSSAHTHIHLSLPCGPFSLLSSLEGRRERAQREESEQDRTEHHRSTDWIVHATRMDF